MAATVEESTPPDIATAIASESGMLNGLVRIEIRDGYFFVLPFDRKVTSARPT
jgi:hypothetical protein